MTTADRTDLPPPALRLTWLFGAGADPAAHRAMTASGADVLIQDLEDFTPPPRRPQARDAAGELYAQWRRAAALACVRINDLQGEGPADLRAVMPARPDIVAYPKACTADEIRRLDEAIGALELQFGIAAGATEILPVCETALGVVNLREIAAASPRGRGARGAVRPPSRLSLQEPGPRGPHRCDRGRARRKPVTR